jgi:hypothetical protein
MATIPGASRFINSATLANSRGIAPSTPNVLGTGGSTQSLLDTGRGINSSGLGLSGGARAVNSQLISSSNAGFNKLFSLNGVEFGTNETLAQKILAIRASVPESRLARGVGLDEEV